MYQRVKNAAKKLVPQFEDEATAVPNESKNAVFGPKPVEPESEDTFSSSLVPLFEEEATEVPNESKNAVFGPQPVEPESEVTSSSSWIPKFIKGKWSGKDTSVEDEDTAVPNESISELMSIPTTSHFKQRTWKNQNIKNIDNIDKSNAGQCKVFSADKKQHIKEKNIDGRIVYSAQLNIKKIYIKIHASGSLLTCVEHNFAASYRIDTNLKLDLKKPFIDSARTLHSHLAITEVLRDDLRDKRNESYSNFKEFLQNVQCVEDFSQFSQILDNYIHRTPFDAVGLLKDILKNKTVSKQFPNITRVFLNCENALHDRNKKLPNFDDPAKPCIKGLLEDLQNIPFNWMESRRNSLRVSCATHGTKIGSSMLSTINAMSDQQILYVGNKDIILFCDLSNSMDEDIFKEFLDDLQKSFFGKIYEISATGSSLNEQDPLTHQLYFYLCKSFQDLIKDIQSKTDIMGTDLLKKDDNDKWQLKQTFKWPMASDVHDCLEQQYRFIFTLMAHYDPGHYSKTNSFQYNLKSLKNIVDIKHLSEDRLVWLYILDNSISSLLNNEELGTFKPLIQGYIEFLENTQADLHESFRVATHNVLRFVAQTRVCLSGNILEVDCNILKKQIESIKKSFSNQDSDEFRNLIDAYNGYWKNRQTILKNFADKFPYGSLKLDMEKISHNILVIIASVLEKDTKSSELKIFFRSFNVFLENLNSVRFDWLIKKSNYTSHVEVVNGDNDSYKVLDVTNFMTEYSNNLPKHYVIEIIHDLMECVNKLLDQGKWSEGAYLNAAAELFSAITDSFLYLKDQHTYRSFDLFKDESTKPFISVVENCVSYDDFQKRITIVGKSYYFLRKQNEIDIVKALELFEMENDDTSTDILKSCYDRYLKTFDAYVIETLNMPYKNKLNHIITKVRDQIKPTYIQKWNSYLKRANIPDILAGLAAMWSIQTSMDIFDKSNKSLLKPHCIQILCILRLLSVDKDGYGVVNHIAQVLTGQGKSLVLGLLATLLALMGHKVRMVCYSKYLASRDEQDFRYLFKQFGNMDITYGTFEEMAEEVLEPEVNDKKLELRDLVKNRIKCNSEQQSGLIKQNDITNTILLIDEVDVFFCELYYGNTYGAVAKVDIPALDKIQEKVWELAQRKTNKAGFSEQLEEFINKNKVEFKEFNIFRLKPEKYYLLKEKGSELTNKEYTNRSLYEEHLEDMIDTAIKVANGSDKDWFFSRYKIDGDGCICCRKNDGNYSASSVYFYYNIFNYFRLKKNNFDRKNNINYGYIYVACGEVSYAKLPEEYPVILGVSGTLTSLNYYENKAVRDFYKIRTKSIMPSFFGCSNLKFDPIENFSCQYSEQEWLNKIFKHSDSKINSEQSVLIFFDTCKEMDLFETKFLGKFDRLYILTEDTREHWKDQYVQEAGHPRTITLATRGMGRGVDYKSSVDVEKNGGIHVIQTFLSLDIKEETQIKGRTARKDNKGSYELILCKKHLIASGFLGNNAIHTSYRRLNDIRNEEMKSKDSKKDKSIIESAEKHKTTISFFESFFNKKNT